MKVALNTIKPNQSTFSIKTELFTQIKRPHFYFNLNRFRFSIITNSWYMTLHNLGSIISAVSEISETSKGDKLL